MTPTTTSSGKSASLAPRQPRRLSPEFVELLHMLSSLDSKPTSGTAASGRD